MMSFKKRFMGMALSAMLVVSSVSGVFADEIVAAKTKALNVNGAEVSIPEDSVQVIAGKTYILPTSIATVFGTEEAKLNLLSVSTITSNGAVLYNLRETANLLGYEVGFDAKANKILLFNVDQVLDGVEFGIFNKAIAFGREVVKNNKSYETKGKFDMEASIGSGEELVKLGLNGDFVSLSNATKSDSVVNLKLNLDDLLKILTSLSATPEDEEEAKANETEIQKLKDVFAMLKDMKIEVRTDLEKGIVALKSEALSKVFDGQADTWYALDINTLFSMSGSQNTFADMIKLANSDEAVDFKDMVKVIITTIPLDNELNVQARTAILETYTKLFSDSAFTDKLGKYTSEYVMEESGAKVSMNISIPHQGDKVTGMDFVMKLEDLSGEKPVEMMNFVINQDKDYNTKATMSFNVPELATVKFNYDAKVTTSSKKPAGAAIGTNNVIMITEELLDKVA